MQYLNSKITWVGTSSRLHFIIVNFIIVKNTCAGKRMGRHGYISLLSNLIIVKITCVSHNNPFAENEIRIWRDETIGQLIITIIASFIVVFMIFDNLLIP